jgi:hypothetical protein
MIIILILIIIKFEEKKYYYKKRYRFDLKSKIKNYKNLDQTCLVLLIII